MGIPEGADLMITPISPPEKHFIRLYGNAELAEDGTLTGELNLLAEGQSDASIRRMFTGSFMYNWEKNLEHEIRAIHPNAKILETDYKDPYRYMDGPIKIKIKYEIPDYALVSSEEIIIHSFIGSGIFKRAMAHLYTNTSIKERKYDFRDRCSRFVKFNEAIKLPGEYSLVHVPQYEAFENSVTRAEGEYTISKSGKTLRMIQEVVFNKRIYKAEEWDDYKKAVIAQKTFSDEPIILKKQ
jgi:hypothetical protein